jgi:hypothetical protein
MAECKVKENLKHCTCSYTSCSKRGICCDCIKSHRAQGELPGCYFPPDVEKTGERSIEKFAELVKERGKWW